MINFDCLTLTALLEEIYPVIVGSRVHKVQQPGKSIINLTLRSRAKHKKLCISAHPQYSYIALLDNSKREFVNPSKPPMFCMLLRKHMEGAKILDLKQPKNERILEIHFESFNELGDRMPMILACEIMGKYSNVILYVAETKLILGCAHNVGELMSSQRELAGSLPYILPPAQDKLSILDITLDKFMQMSMALDDSVDQWLSKTFHNISLATAKELCNTAGVKVSREHSSLNTKQSMEKLYNLSNKLIAQRDFKPSLSSDMKYYSLVACDPSINWRQVDSVNMMVDLYFAHHIENDMLNQLKGTLRSRISREVKKITNRLLKYNEVIERAENSDIFRIKADILTSNLHKLEQGLKEVALENFYDNNAEILIQLDPLLTPNQNAQKFYKRYNKAKSSLKVSKERREKELNELNYLESVLLSIDQASDLKTLEEIQEELNTQIKSQAHLEKDQKKKEKINITRFLSTDGFEILVGRNNKQNDFLISKLAHPKDLWLHTQTSHGSHVIVKTDRGNNEIPKQTLHEAALLAGYYSEGRFSSNVSVVYTLMKFVKKPTGSKPGFVVYSGEKTLYVNPLEEHVAPILDKIQLSSLK